MRQRYCSFLFALFAVALGSTQSRAALSPISISAESIQAVDRAAASGDMGALNAAASAIYRAAGSNTAVLAAAVGAAVKGSRPPYIPTLVAAFVGQSKDLVPQEAGDQVITAASCAAENDSPEALKVAAEIAAAVAAAPELAPQIAAAAAAVLPVLAPVIASAAAKAVPASAAEIAASATAAVPAKAAFIAARVAKATPTQAAIIAVAVLQATQPLRGATAENQEIATCIAGAVPETGELVTAAIDQATLNQEVLGNPIPLINVSSPH